MPISSATAGVYYIPPSTAPWLWPLLDITGLSLQAVAILARTKWLIWAGFVLVLLGCFPERDIALAIGDLILALTLHKITPGKI